MKKLVFLTSLVLLALASCKKDGPVAKVESIAFDSNSYEILENDYDLNLRKKLVITPSGIIDTCKITWKVSDTDVAEMEGNYLVPLMPGDVKVTATVQGKSATCTVYIQAVPVESITLKDMTVALYGSSQIQCETEPSGISIRRIAFTSSDDDVAYVNSDGMVQGKGVGEATITAKVDGKEATCKVTVKKINVTNVIVSPSAYRVVEIGGQVQLTVTIEPADASVKSVSWKSDKESVATVDENGLVTTHTEGNAMITATVDGVSGQCSISMVNYGSVTDVEGHTYRTVKIGNQVWMADNLKCSKYTAASGVTSKMSHYTVCPTDDYAKYDPFYVDPSDKTIWESTKDNRMSEEQLARAGYLYNWAAAMGLSNGIGNVPESSGNRQGICPDGWHLPKMSELKALEQYIDNIYGTNTYSRHLYSSSGWTKMYIDGKWVEGSGYDTFGFDALPVGWTGAVYDGETILIHGISCYCNFWTATQSSSDATKRYAEAFRTDSSNERNRAYSVRCVKN